MRGSCAARGTHALLRAWVVSIAVAQSTRVHDGIIPTTCGTFHGAALPQAPGVWAFRGIRYAASPTGTWRWRPPQPAQCSPGRKIPATQNGQPCTQKNPIVNIIGFSQPGRVIRALGSVLLGFAILLNMFILWTLHEDSVIAAVIGNTIHYKLLEDAGGPVRRISHWFRCGCAFILYALGSGLLYISFEHRAYLGSSIGGEDCLFLNVYAHSDALASSLTPSPVLFFMHGGDLTLGSGADSGPGGFYGGSWALAAAGRAIAVQINYRLNLFGFLHLEDEFGESVFENSTNLGLLDQLAALRWVQYHIRDFGGDPRRVTIYGHSSGGTCITALLASPLARGLFHGAFTMSASPRIDATPTEAAVSWRKYFLHALPECAGKRKAQDLRVCLYALPAAKLVAAMSSQYTAPDWMAQLPVAKQVGSVIYMIVADGNVVIGNVSNALAVSSKDLPEVPAVFGSVREEEEFNVKQVGAHTNFANAAWPFLRQSVVQWGMQLVGDIEFGEKVWGLYKPNYTPHGAILGADRAAYTSLARERWSQLTSDMRSICGNMYNAKQLARKSQGPVYSYIFTHRPSSPVSSHLNGWPAWIFQDTKQYAFHMWDNILLFNRTAGFHNQDKRFESYMFTALDFAVADRFRAALLDFAEAGLVPGWTPVTPEGHSVCNIASEKTVCEANLKKSECALFHEYDVAYRNWIVN